MIDYGDGPVVFKSYEIVKNFTAVIHTGHFPNVEAVARDLSRGSATSAQQVVAYGKSYMHPGLQYFLTKFSTDLKNSVTVLKAAQLFVPYKEDKIRPTAAGLDQQKYFPFLDKTPLFEELKKELSSYLPAAAGVSAATD